MKEDSARNTDDLPEITDEKPQDEEWERCLSKNTEDLKKQQLLMSRTPHECNLRNKNLLHLTMKSEKLDKELVMPVVHNKKIDTQVLSYKK